VQDETADLIVVGGGVMGLATAWWAAQSGTPRIVLLERFAHGHVRGASHGGERIFRYGYTDRVYVRLALAADELWQRLEHDTGRTLVDRIGCIDLGAESELGAMAEAMAAEGVAIEWCTPEEAASRWPGFRCTRLVLHQPRAGRSRAADTLDVFRSESSRRGADLRFEQEVLAIEPDSDGVVVRTETGAVRAPVAVVAAGAWTHGLLAGSVDLPPLTTTREQVAFFRPRHAGPWPSFIDRGPTTHFGLPAPDGTVKVGEHHTGPVTTGDARTFDIDEAARARVADYVRERLPGLDPATVDATTCLYTVTPTEDFVLDRVGNVVIGAGFSGHGFKFAPAIGRLLSGMASGDDPPGPPFTISGRAGPPTVGASGHR
jgi:sarcosine oxidase